MAQLDLSFLFWLVLIAATVVSLPASLILLARYRSSVVKEMNQAEQADFGGNATREPLIHSPPATRLAVATADPKPSTKREDNRPDFFRTVSQRTVASVCVYTAAGSAFAAVMTYGWLVVTSDPERPLTKISVLFLSFFWPTALAFAWVLATRRRSKLAAIGAYWAALGSTIAWVLTRNPEMTFSQLMFYWAFVAGPPTLMLASVMWNRIRAISILVLPLTALVLAGFAISFMLLVQRETVILEMVDSSDLLEQDLRFLFWVLAASVVVLLPGFGWRRLDRLVVRYERREISSEALQIDSIFLFFAIIQSIQFAKDWLPGILVSVFALSAYRLIFGLGIKVTRALYTPNRPINLLILRVFDLGVRSERFFSSLRKLWLRQGSIVMVAGPDLATSTIEPHKVLQFVEGKLPHQFVGDSSQLDERVKTMDRHPLPDGRYRINEFFCHTNAWKPTMQRLVNESDVVLMDIRSFSDKHQGCIYELGQLIDMIDLRRVLFLVDDSTDKILLQRTLEDLWSRSSLRSPNRTLAHPTATLFECHKAPERVLLPLLAKLLAFSEANR